MCGIAGYIGTHPPGQGEIQAALESMHQRGPDHRDHRVFLPERGGSVALLHARLSIIDLDARSNQPFSDEDLHLVFNGEIYNYVEIREKLVERGHRFRTHSDTEVLIKAYREWGLDCTAHFEGMWAFALWDAREELLMISRDPFGEKPLYLHRDEHGLYFASEVKTLKRLSAKSFPVNHAHLLRYVVNGHKSLYKTAETWYEGIEEFPIASSSRYRADAREVFHHRYWSPRSQVQAGMRMEEAVEGTRERLINSVKLRMRSDVPLAFCLSGGVDSASMVSIAAKEFNVKAHTFSIIDKDPRYNELGNIQATIDDTGCESTQIVLEPGEQNIERLKALIAYHDAPVATISYFVHSLLSEAISEQGYKISVSGTAADELFTGYYDHFNLHLCEMRGQAGYDRYLNEWQTHVQHFVRHPDFRRPDLYFDAPDKRDHIYLNSEVFSGLLTREFSEPFTETDYPGSLLRKRMMNELFHEVVRVILREDDLNSMMYSIENRSPFLDRSLFNWAYSIPSEHLIHDGYNKYILRSAMKGILNEQVRLSREKKGFNASINSIFDFSNPAHLDYFLSDSPVFDLFDRKGMQEVLQRGEFPNSYKKFLFNFINVKLFMEQEAS